VSRPEISVIIPVHNAAETLVEQLDSVHAAQTNAPPGEILVVDNRSTDRSAALATEWARARNVELRVIDAGERAGEPFARNVGLAAARGDHVLFCDADDRVAPTWISSMTHTLRTASYATGPIDMHELNPTWIADVRGSSVTGRSLLYDRVPYAHGCNMGFRRDALVALGGFDESYTAGCDLDIAIRMWEAGHELGYDDGAVIHYRLRQTLRETYRQGRFYGRFRVPIRRRLAAAGVATGDASRSGRRLFWLARKAPVAAVHRPTRARWVWVLGQVVGERLGTREFRETR
jgi:glycosyltransferase involved in cell wall biosynthesis